MMQVDNNGINKTPDTGLEKPRLFEKSFWVFQVLVFLDFPGFGGFSVERRPDRKLQSWKNIP